MWVTIVETAEFKRAAERIFSGDECEALVAHLAGYPEAGDLLSGTGGVRKLRWGARGKGKRGGARVVYFFRRSSGTLYLLTAFGKGERANISQAERNAIKKLVKSL
jgi:hypothetical protein